MPETPRPTTPLLEDLQRVAAASAAPPAAPIVLPWEPLAAVDDLIAPPAPPRPPRRALPGGRLAAVRSLDVARERRRTGVHAADESITCPDCRRTSWHPMDVREGYCGGCKAFTTPTTSSLLPLLGGDDRG